MLRENIHQSLEVYYEKVSICPIRDRQFNFFEFVYVLSGEGSHAVNGNRISYKSGDLFLITPNDRHEFDLLGECEFMIIRFGQDYIKEYQWKSIDHMEYLLYYASHLSGPVLSDLSDKQTVDLLMINLRDTAQKNTMYGEDLLRHLVNAVIVIVARNIAIVKPKGISNQADVRVLNILDHIQENIYQPELLRIAVIAEKFGLSETYLGSYFLKQCGETLQHYISAYRLRLIEHRLRFSDKRINEIADEFGFADESHVNKFFRRHRGMSLNAFRKLSYSV